MKMSTLEFNPNTGLIIPETWELREEIAARFKSAFAAPGIPELNTEPSTPAGQLVDVLVAEIESKNAQILYLSNMFNPKVADGRWQDALGYIYFLNRKNSESTIVTCQIKGLIGTKIPYGSLVEDINGRRFLHNKLNVVIGESGEIESTFRSVTPGPVDVGPNTVTKIIMTVPGWDSVNNETAGVTGRDIETRVDFEARRINSVAKNAHGTISSIYGTLHDLSGQEGVIDVQVLENIGPEPITKFGVEIPAHGITVCIYEGNDTDIAKVLYEKKDAGCDTGGNTVVSYSVPELNGATYQYKILRPYLMNFWVRVILGTDEPVTETLIAKIKEAINRDFHGLDSNTQNPRVGLASTVFASRFYCSVLNVPVKNLSKISIGLGELITNVVFSELVVINGDQEPVLSENNVIVETE
jgi:hypothetical protein